MATEFHFNTKHKLIKRNGCTILGLYPEEDTARKMVQTRHILRHPPGLTLDAEAYDTHIKGRLKWIAWDIEDGRLYWITVSDFDYHKEVIDRGMGRQYAIRFKFLHPGNDNAAVYKADSIEKPLHKPEATPQLAFNFGGAADGKS